MPRFRLLKSIFLRVMFTSIIVNMAYWHAISLFKVNCQYGGYYFSVFLMKGGRRVFH